MRELASTFGFAIDPDAKIEDISVGQQQRVEILKALYRRADILILDEPTAVLTPQEAVELFGILKNLQREGLSIIFISHKLNEVLEIAERVTVLRRGKVIETLPTAGATEAELARRMVGRDVVLRIDKAPSQPADPILVVEGLTVKDDRDLVKVQRRLVRGPRRRDRRDRRRRRERPDRAHRRDHGPPSPGAAAGSSSRGAMSRTRMRGSTSTSASDTYPRTGSAAASCWSSRSRRTSALHDYRKRPYSRLGWLYPKRLVERARG